MVKEREISRALFLNAIEHIGQPILAKKIYDIYKFQLFKNKLQYPIKILNTRRLYLVSIRHF